MIGEGAEQEWAEELVAWAQTNAAALLPDPDDEMEPGEWLAVYRAIESAQYADRWDRDRRLREALAAEASRCGITPAETHDDEPF